MFNWIKSQLLRALAYSVVALFVAIVLLRFIPVYYTGVMLERQLQALWQDKDYQLQHQWVSISQISRHLPQAVVAAEDQKFLQHYGFDVQAIEKAFKHNSKGRSVRGASTISQQTAKNVFLWSGRSYLRKGLESGFTLLIELCWSKQRILEVYLNSVEFGPGVFGVEAAAQHYFNTSAARLSRQQAALLAAVLPNPHRFLVRAPSPYVQKRQQWILVQMGRLPAITQQLAAN